MFSQEERLKYIKKSSYQDVKMQFKQIYEL